MTTATLPMVWKGRSGREYVPAPGRTRLRFGQLSTVRKVVARGEPAGTSFTPEGTPVALKLWREGDESSLDRLQQEARILVELSSRGVHLPSPRIHDLVGDPLVTGLVMEWCPVDLERWWRDKIKEPDAMGRLFAALGDAASRLAEYHEWRAASTSGLEVAHGDVKPTNILLSGEGRWLVSGFGAPPFAPPDDEVWADSQMIVATENFLAPEVLFSARVPYPAAVDSWSLGGTLFALLKLKKMVEDEAPLPFNGTASPRFRTERVGRVFEIFGRDPRRFLGRDLDPSVFQDPDSMPEEDRRAVRECMRGSLAGGGPDAAAREEQLTEEVVTLLDRCFAIDPSHRFTTLRDLEAAFQNLTRSFLTQTVSMVGPPSLPHNPRDLVEELAQSQKRAGNLAARIAELERALAGRPAAASPAQPPRSRDLAWVAILGMMMLLQLSTLVVVTALMMLMWSGVGR
jgi:serine/threonine protein kinase